MKDLLYGDVIIFSGLFEHNNVKTTSKKMENCKKLMSSIAFLSKGTTNDTLIY